MFLGERTARVNLGLVAVNVIYFLVLVFTGSLGSTSKLLAMGAMSADSLLSKHEVYRLITAMFMHGGISHLFNNMLVLFFLGDNMERVLGGRRYLVFYLLCGVGAGIVSCAWYALTRQPVVSLGASGAIFGVIGGLLYVVIKNHGRLEDLSTGRLGMFIAFSLYFGLSSVGVDNAAHIGGMAVGFLLAMVMYKPPRVRWSEDGILESLDDPQWH
ncbi:MAG: rhomboid family intramembrane serine protease [Lachnospiraceae bacterium]|nr:rhomboid family intramembrane serine protease [Lachnospiraceae bacterium]